MKNKFMRSQQIRDRAGIWVVNTLRTAVKNDEADHGRIRAKPS